MTRALTLLLAVVLGCGDSAQRADVPDGTSLQPPSDASANGGGVARDTDARDATPFEGTLGATNRDAAPDAPLATLTEVRTAEREAGFERLVFEFNAPVPGYTIEYSARPTECGSGRPADVRGNRFLVVRLRPAQAHEARGSEQVSSIDQRDLGLEYKAVRHLLVICDFEATVAWAVGVDSQRPYRAFELENPARLVVDIQTAPRTGAQRPATEPLVSATPQTASVGATVRVDAAGFPRSSNVLVGFGPPDSEFRVVKEVETSITGTLATSITVPAWAQGGRQYVIVVSTPDYQRKGISNPVRIGS